MSRIKHRYEVLDLINEGICSSVYKGNDSKKDKVVAIKIVSVSHSK